MYQPLRKKVGSTVNIGTSSTLALNANESRKFAILINNSDEDIYIDFGEAASVDSGVRISAGGFSYEIDRQNLWAGSIYAIHGGSGLKQLLVMEFS